MRSIAGGVCTAWKRKGYTIDGAVNWVVRTRPGIEFYSFWEDWVISAADDRTTIFDMLGGTYLDEKVKRRYDNPKLFRPLVYVGLGVAGQVEGLTAFHCGTAIPPK